MSIVLRWALVACLAVACLLYGASVQAAPCPTRARDAAFDFAADYKYCQLGAAEGNPPGARYGRVYNVYCPGRLTSTSAAAVATALAKGQPVEPGRSVATDYAPLGLTARLASGGVKHLFHYSCGTGGVATHLKLEYDAAPPTSELVAKHCKLVAETGGINVGWDSSREYRCDVQLFDEERGAYSAASTRPNVKAVARLKLISELKASLARNPVKLCFQDTTDIQCAPCRSSNKLVVRTKTTWNHVGCPAGTYAEYVPDFVDMGVVDLSFNLASKSSATTGTVVVTGVVKSIGTKPWVCLPGASACRTVKLYQGTTLLQSIPVSSLAPGAAISVSKALNWSTKTVTDFKVRIEGPAGLDFITGNDVMSRPSWMINKLF